jgi:predicted membrane channel-forming protein YqfA (hemolysin III family)
MIDRVETVAEEFASSISHGIGLVGSIAALPVLILATRRHKDPWLMTGS